jgi:hypothetical protein
VVAAVVWAVIDGHWWTNMAPAQDAVVTLAGFLWLDGSRADRAKRRAVSPDPQ